MVQVEHSVRYVCLFCVRSKQMHFDVSTKCWLSVLFQELPTYNEKRRGTISAATLRNLQRSRSNPQLSLLFQSGAGDPAAAAGQRSDTSPVRAAASLSSAYQYQHGGFVAHGDHQPAEPTRRSSILRDVGQSQS